MEEGRDEGYLGVRLELVFSRFAHDGANILSRINKDVCQDSGSSQVADFLIERRHEFLPRYEKRKHKNKTKHTNNDNTNTST